MRSRDTQCQSGCPEQRTDCNDRPGIGKFWLLIGQWGHSQPDRHIHEWMANRSSTGNSHGGGWRCRAIQSRYQYLLRNHHARQYLSGHRELHTYCGRCAHDNIDGSSQWWCVHIRHPQRSAGTNALTTSTANVTAATVTVGQSTTVDLSYTNPTSNSVALTTGAITLSQPAIMAVSADACSNVTLASGASCTATVTVSPSTAGSYSGTASLSLSGGGTAAVVTISGTANQQANSGGGGGGGCSIMPAGASPHVSLCWPCWRLVSTGSAVACSGNVVRTDYRLLAAIIVPPPVWPWLPRWDSSILNRACLVR